MERVNSVRFKRSISDLENVKVRSIIFQRINKFRYLKVLFHRSYKKGGTDDQENDVIVLRKMPPISKDYGTNDILELDDLEDLEENFKNITDAEFKKACQNASIQCHKYAKFFLVAETISKFSELFLLCVIPLYQVLDFNSVEIIIFLSILIPVILIQVSCDWSKLLEKYSRLCYEFSALSISKDEKRIEEFQKLAFNFQSSFMYTDMLGK